MDGINKNDLLTSVITEIQNDVYIGDMTAILELISSIPIDKLLAYLSEEDEEC